MPHPAGLCGLAPLPRPAGAAPAAARPFQGRVSATWDNVFDGFTNPPATFTGRGAVRPLGKTTQTGTLFLSTIANQDGLYPGYGFVKIVTADGDGVTLDFEALLDLQTGEGLGTFTFTGGKGRFANVIGGGTFDTSIDLAPLGEQPMTVLLDGTISYQPDGRRGPHTKGDA